MNKIFKVIYSKTRHCYVVVSELAKSHCKTTQSHTVRSKTALTAAVLLALGAFSFVGMPVVQAADGTESLRNNDFVGANDYYWYYDEKEKDKDKKWKTYQYKATDIFNNRSRHDLPNYQGGGAKLPGAITAGLYAQAGQQTVTIGDRNAGQSKGSVFIGEHSGYNNGDNAPAGMKNNYVTSVGFQSDATGWGSIAIGSNATAENSKMESQVVEEVGDAHTSGTVRDDTYGIKENPKIQGASVALGYNAHSNDGNIAIGSYSDATSTDKNDSYVSVGNANLKRRITNVADGASASDVATVGQLQALSDKVGVYDAGFGIKIASDKDNKTNTISLNRNLGTNYTDKAHHGDEKVTVAVDDTGLVLGGYAEDEKGNKKNPAVTYGATGDDSVTVGGMNSLASGRGSVVTGGVENIASGATAVAIGGNNNDAIGTRSAVLGGLDNTAFGNNSMVSGGSYNVAGGIQSAVLGGFSNYALGTGTTSIGGYGKDYGTGYDSSVNGDYSVGVAGGSTGKDAKHALAAGNQAVVTTENGTAIGYQATTDKAKTIAFGHDAGDVSGYTIEWNKLPKGQVNADGTANDYTKAPKSVTPTTYKDAYYNRLVKVADGQDDHDVVVMEQLKNASDVGSKIKVYQTDENGNIKFDKNNNPIEDTSDSDAVKTKREAAQKASEDAWGEAIGTGKVEANNSQLVTGDTVYNAIQNQAEWKLTTNGESADKAAAIKPGTTVNFSAENNGKDHSNVTISHNGSNVTIGLDKDIVLGDTSHSSGGSLNVYTDSSDGNNLSNHVSINGSTISVNYPKSNDDKKTTTDTRGVVLGVGKEDSKPDGYIAFNNVEGGYTYLHASTDASDDKKGRLEYVGSDGNKKYIANLDDVSTAVNNAKTKYYAVNEKAPLMNLKDYKNEGNDGAKGKGSLAAGFVTHADGIASTVVGSYSGVMNKGTALGPWGLDYRGATAVSLGTVNVNNNTDTSKPYSGVANSIVGQANMTTNSNAAIIYGAGNTVTDSYRPIDEKKAAAISRSISDQTKLSKAMQDAVKESGGQVMVMGGVNNVESAYMSQVVGVGNTVKGNQVKNTKGEWGTDTSDTAIKDYNSEKSSQYNYVDGFNNEVINGKHDYIIGANNKLDGDSYDDNNAKPIKRSNKSNVVIGDNHALTGKKNNVIIGSADTEGTLTRASDAVIIGHKANATSDTGADNAVAIGLSATAGGGNAVTIGVNTSAGEDSITIGSESSAISGQNIAIGRYARVYGDKVTKAVALGQKAEAHVADGVAIGSGSIATVAGNSVEGYDPTTGQTSEDTTATWKATKAAVSIGTADGKVTRQINGVAAGTNDTDAVNVAQIKKLASINASNIGANLQYGADGTTAATDTDKTKNKEAWATAIGTGTVTKDDDGSKQMVTGSTVYNEVRPSKDGEYVKMSQTTGDNLLKLDDQVKQNAQNIFDNTYTQGDGILMDKTKKTISVNQGDGLKFTEDHKLAVNTGKHLSVNTDGQIDVGDNGTVAENDGNLVTGDTVYKALNGGMTKMIIGTPGKDGKDGKDGTPGTIGLVGPAGTNGKDGAVDITIQKGEDGKDGTKGANGVDGTDGINRIVYEDKNGKHQVATMEDGLKFAGDDGQKDTNKVIAKKLNNTVDIIGGADNTKLTENNIGVNNVDGKLKVQLAQDLTVITSISNQTTTGDKTTGAKITLGTDGATTISGGDVSVSNNKITNIKAGEVKENSKDAVNGDQLYNEQKARTDADTAINTKIGTFDNSKTYNYIDKTASISTNLTTLDTHVKKNAEDISRINTRIDTLDGNAVKYDDSTKSKITLAGSDGTTIDQVKDGTISSTSKEAVNGGQLNTEQQTRIAADKAITDKIGSLEKDGNYIKKDATISQNLNKLDTQVKTNADAISKETTDREAADKAITDKIGSLEKDGNYIKKDATISQNLNKLDTQVKDNSDKIAQNTKDISEIKTNVRDLTDNAVQYDNDSKKSKITLAGDKGTTITNVKDGSVGKDSKDAVNGGQLFDEKTARENADTEIKTDITKIKDGEGFTDKGKTVIKSLAQDAVDVKGSDYVTVTNETKDGTKTFTVSVDGNGKVASGDKGLISGDTIYNELRPSADGSYIKQTNTTAQNLVSLDTQVKKTSDLINSDGKIIKIGGSDAATKIDVNGKDGKGRVITGVVSDANDPNSAANVGYVNGLTAANTQQIYRDMNNAYSRLDTNINRAAAGSNALAALHPLDFDPADKASFAVGYGHYRNANAAAVGAFYQPNANTMVNMGISLGNGDPGFNAGVSFKIGKGSAYNGVSKAEMAQTIHDQATEISAIKADDAAKDKRIDALEKENQEMKKQIQEILARLNG